MNQFRKSLAKRQKLTEAPKIDGKVNQVIWYGHSSGEATMTIHQKHHTGQHGVDQAAFTLLKAHLAPPLRALTRLKVDNVPIRTGEGNYYLVTVEFQTKRD